MLYYFYRRSDLQKRLFLCCFLRRQSYMGLPLQCFIVFASLSIVYLFKTRAQLRVLITGLWIFLGTVNGIILSNRVTPFSYTDFKMLPDLFAMQNTNYFTAEEATVVVAVVASFDYISGSLLYQRTERIRENATLYFPTCDRCTVSCRYSDHNTGCTEF